MFEKVLKSFSRKESLEKWTGPRGKGKSILLWARMKYHINLLLPWTGESKKHTHFLCGLRRIGPFASIITTAAQNILFLQGWRLWALWMPSFNNASSKSLCLSESGRCSIIPIMILIFQFANNFFPESHQERRGSPFKSNCQIPKTKWVLTFSSILI